MDAIGQFIEMKDHTHRDLTLTFLSSLHVEVTRVPQCKEGYNSFYLQGEFYELNLSILNSMFSFLLDLDLPWHQVPLEFNLNVFRDVSRDRRYNKSLCKDTSLGILINGWPNACFPMVSLLRMIV